MKVDAMILNGEITDINLNDISDDEIKLTTLALKILRGKKQETQHDKFLSEVVRYSSERALVVDLLKDVSSGNYKDLIAKGEKYQKYVLVQWLAGWAALTTKKYEIAEKFYYQAVLLQPQSYKPAWALGEYYFVIRDYSRAIQWYYKSLSLGQDRWEFKWIVRYIELWQTLAGSLWKTTFFVLAWLALAVIGIQRAWLWVIPYLGFVGIHSITIAACWRIGDVGKMNLIALRAAILTISVAVIVWIWKSL